MMHYPRTLSNLKVEFMQPGHFTLIPSQKQKSGQSAQYLVVPENYSKVEIGQNSQQLPLATALMPFMSWYRIAPAIQLVQPEL